MEAHIINYINSQKIGVIAVEMLDGSPHAATVHYAFHPDSSSVYIMTDRSYKKCEPIIKNGKTRASFVVGTNEAEIKTIQMDGEVVFAEADQDKERFFAVYPDRKDGFKDGQDVILKFTPTWWRFTDVKAEDGRKIISSEQ